MKKTADSIQALAGVLVLALSFLPAAAFAREEGGVGLSVTSDISTQIEAGDNDNEGVSAQSTTNIKSQERSDNESERDGQSGEASSTDNRGDDELNSDDLNDEADDESDEADDTIEIDHDSAEEASTTIDTPEHVTNRGQLRSFLNHVVKGDDRIANLLVSSTTIEAHYDLPAKFLWTIPVSLTAQVSVQSDGSVSITYPWYAFLFATRKDEISAQLSQIGTSTVGTSSTEALSASAQAHLLNLLFSALRGSNE
jgi:hypothetical protein